MSLIHTFNELVEEKEKYLILLQLPFSVTWVFMFSASPRIVNIIRVLCVNFHFATLWDIYTIFTVQTGKRIPSVFGTRALGKIVLQLLLVIVFEVSCVFVNKGKKIWNLLEKSLTNNLKSVCFFFRSTFLWKFGSSFRTSFISNSYYDFCFWIREI